VNDTREKMEWQKEVEKGKADGSLEEDSRNMEWLWIILCLEHLFGR